MREEDNKKPEALGLRLFIVLFFDCLFCQCSPYELTKERMRTVGTAFQFRVELHGHKPGMIRYLYNFYQVSVFLKPE